MKKIIYILYALILGFLITKNLQAQNLNTLLVLTNQQGIGLTATGGLKTITLRWRLDRSYDSLALWKGDLGSLTRFMTITGKSQIDSVIGYDSLVYYQVYGFKGNDTIISKARGARTSVYPVLAPINFLATGGDSLNTITFTLPDSGQYVSVEYSVEEDGTYYVLDTNSTGSLTHTSLEPSSIYWYKGRTYYSRGWSAYASDSAITNAEDLTPDTTITYENLLANPRFEVNATGWSAAFITGSGSITRVDSNTITGAGSGYLTCTGETNNSRPRLTASASRAGATDTTYTVQFKIRNDDTTAIKWAGYHWSGKTTYLNQTIQVDSTYSFSGTVVPTASNTDFFIYFDATVSSGILRVSVDDFLLSPPPDTTISGGAPSISAPTLPSATGGDFQVFLSWTNGDTYDSVQVYRGTSSGNTSWLTSLDGAQDTLTDKSLTHNTRYYYKFRGKAGAVFSNFTSEVNAITTDTTTYPAPDTTSYFPVYAQTVSGTNYYYADAANGGDNGNDGLTPATPKLTLPFANSTFMSALQPGDSILIKRGSEYASYNDIYGTITGTKNGRIVIGAYGTKGTEVTTGVYDNDPYLHAGRTYCNAQCLTIQNIRFDDFTYRITSWSAGSSSPYPAYDNGIAVTTTAYFARLNTTAYNSHDIQIQYCTFREPVAFQNRTHPSHIPYEDNYFSDLKELGTLSKLEMAYNYFPDTQTWGGDRVNMGLIGDSVWFHNNTMLGAFEECLDIGSGQHHIIENNVMIDPTYAGIKLHSQGGWADSSIIRFNTIIKDNSISYCVVIENTAYIYIYNNTLVGVWALGFWNRDRFRLEAYYGDIVYCVVYNNIVVGYIYVGGQWSNEMLDDAQGVYKWDSVYTFTSYNSTTASLDTIAVTDFGRFTGYTPIGMGQGDTLFTYNDLTHNTYISSKIVRFAQTGDFPNQNGATNNDYNLNNNTYWLRSRTGEEAVSSISFTDDQSASLPSSLTISNYGNYSASGVTIGRSICLPGWTTYQPSTDYSGNSINLTTPNRGANQ